MLRDIQEAKWSCLTLLATCSTKWQRKLTSWLRKATWPLGNVDVFYYSDSLQLYFKTKPPEANKGQPTPSANGTTAPGVLPRPLPPPPPPPPPPQGSTSSTSMVITPRGPLPPPMENGPRPMLPGGNLPAAPPPPVGGGAMAHFNPGPQMGRPPVLPPPQGFPGQHMKGQGVRLPPPPSSMG